MKRALVTALLLAALCARAAERAQDFAWLAPVEAPESAALLVVELPAVVHQRATRRDLGDLRVFNAAGEVVPHAFRPLAPAAPAAGELTPLPIFPLRAERGGAVEGIDLQVETRRDGSVLKLTQRPPRSGEAVVVGYVLDATTLARAPRALQPEWPGRGSLRVRVEASDDLARWRTVVAEAALVDLEHAGERLQAKRIELAPERALYLRLVRSGGDGPFQLDAVHAEMAGAGAPIRFTWKSFVVSPVAGRAGEYQLDLGGPFPVERVRIDLPQPNSVARLDLLARSRSNEDWRAVAQGMAYRLAQPGREVVSPPLEVSGAAERFWLLRFAQAGGGIGAGEPTVHVGWRPRELVFAARGAGPFRLAFGHPAASPSALPIESLVPGYGTTAALQLREVKLGEPVAGEGAGRTVVAKADLQRWGLWGLLVGGVLVLAWMAMRLLRQLDRAPADSADKASDSERGPPPGT